MSEEINPPPPPQLTPQQQETENALTAFRPAPPQMNRDTLMYAAGMAAGKRAANRQMLPWKVAAAFLICATTTFALWHSQRLVYVDRPEISRVVPAANISIPVASASLPTALLYIPDGDSYLQTRQRILVLGLNALPSLPESSAPRAPSSPQHTRSDLLDAAPAWQRRAASTGDHS